jgi:hypothetical protein
VISRRVYCHTDNLSEREGKTKGKGKEGGEKVKLEEWRGSGGAIAPGAGEMECLSIMEKYGI